MINLSINRRKAACLICCASVLLLMAAHSAQAQPPVAAAPATPGSRADRTAQEYKIQSDLMLAVRAITQPAQMAALAPSLHARVQSFIAGHVASDQTLFIVIKTSATADVVAALRGIGSTEISAFAQYNTVTARVPVGSVLSLAVRADVNWISPKERVRTNRYIPAPDKLKKLSSAVTNAGRDRKSVV